MFFAQRFVATQWRKITGTLGRMCGFRNNSKTHYQNPFPKQANAVICGGGIMGTSVAYHLAKLGWKDIVLLEQGRLAGGSIGFSAGILTTVRDLDVEVKMANYSKQLYQQLEQETGVNTGYTTTGSISLAQTQDPMTSLTRIASQLKIMDIPCEVIPPERVAQLHPFVNTRDLVGALLEPEDGVLSSTHVTFALANGAAANGPGRDLLSGVA
ncbi:pyruvate dehydrogenase phosphatase regulatory subunit, mitochondrial-like [Erythrolamprus reginae]|uniref:pyruvate dehydrogenase phosphatase regulatory subunit, mitochondrial-like n=1 Tax=Erythrolamprus reginae TaxID=121349 RepID=UPI00396CDAA9